MAIQKLPPFYNMNYCQSDGKLTTDGYLYNDQMFQALNLLVNMFNSSASIIVTDDPLLTAQGITQPALIGTNPPSFSTAQIGAILAVNAVSNILPQGTMWYNNTLHKLQFLANGNTIETITSA